MRISEVMSAGAETGTPEQTLRQAAEIMARSGSGFLPVGKDDRLVGTLTDRDIVVRGLAEGRGPDDQIGDVMTKEVKYVTDTDDSDQVALNMGELKVRRLPVVDSDKRLVGVVSIGDIATKAGSSTVESALQDIASAGGPHDG